MASMNYFLNIVYYVIKYCVLKDVLVVFVMFCIDDNPLFGFLDHKNYYYYYFCKFM